MISNCMGPLLLVLISSLTNSMQKSNWNWNLQIGLNQKRETIPLNTSSKIEFPPLEIPNNEKEKEITNVETNTTSPKSFGNSSTKDSSDDDSAKSGSDKSPEKRKTGGLEEVSSNEAISIFKNYLTKNAEFKPRTPAQKEYDNSLRIYGEVQLTEETEYPPIIAYKQQ
jgi:hypothetical protein